MFTIHAAKTTMIKTEYLINPHNKDVFTYGFPTRICSSGDVVMSMGGLRNLTDGNLKHTNHDRKQAKKKKIDLN